MANRDHLGAFGSGGAFTGFETADFDAYLEKKWTSNAYTLERRRAKDRLLALSRAIEQELEEDIADLEMGASDEAPSVANGRKVKAQWAYFTRGANARQALQPLLNRTNLSAGAALFDISVQHQHACIALKLDQDGLAVSVELADKAAVDRDNLKAKLQTEEGLAELLELSRSLPGGCAMGFEGDLVTCLDVEESHAQGWLQGFDSDKTFLIEALIPKEEEVLASDAFIGTAAEYVAELLPAFDFVAWSPQNDFAKLQLTLSKEKKKAKEKKVDPELEAGARVTILAGLFAGRPGYLAEIEKGKAKVMVGPVSVTVDIKDVKKA